MEWIIENWFVVVSVLALLATVALTIVGFVKLPKTLKSERFKRWLLNAVTEAEKEMGSGTGELKLLSVYNRFIERYPVLSIIIPFKSFKKMVDDSLKQMRILLANDEIKEYIEKGENLQEQYSQKLVSTEKKLECAMCLASVEQADEHNGEMLCQECYDENKEVIKYG